MHCKIVASRLVDIGPVRSSDACLQIFTACNIEQRYNGQLRILSLKDALDVYRAPASQGHITGYEHTIRVYEALQEIVAYAPEAGGSMKYLGVVRAEDLVQLHHIAAQVIDSPFFSAVLWLGTVLHDLGKGVTGVSDDHLEVGHAYCLRDRAFRARTENLIRDQWGLSASDAEQAFVAISKMIRYHSYLADGIVLGERNLLEFSALLKRELSGISHPEMLLDVLVLINCSDMGGLGFLTQQKAERTLGAYRILHRFMEKQGTALTDADRLWWGQQCLRAWFGELDQVPEVCSDEFLIRLGSLQQVNLVFDVFKVLEPIVRLRFVEWIVEKTAAFGVDAIGLAEDVRKDEAFLQVLKGARPLTFEAFDVLFDVRRTVRDGGLPVKIYIRR